MPNLRVYILFDNVSIDKRFKAGWGFSALVEAEGHHILFDAGPETPVPALEAFGLSPKDVDAVVISHLHRDHYAGLEDLLARKPGIPLYVPSPVPPDLKPAWQLLAQYHEVSQLTPLAEGMWLTAPMGSRIPEMALVMETSSDVVLLTGCAHPGIVEMARYVTESTGRPPSIIIGGLHLMGLRPRKVQQIGQKLRELGVRRVIGCHCTGKESLRSLREILGQDVIRGGAGKSIVVRR